EEDAEVLAEPVVGGAIEFAAIDEHLGGLESGNEEWRPAIDETAALSVAVAAAPLAHGVCRANGRDRSFQFGLQLLEGISLAANGNAVAKRRLVQQFGGALGQSFMVRV